MLNSQYLFIESTSQMHKYPPSCRIIHRIPSTTNMYIPLLTSDKPGRNIFRRKGGGGRGGGGSRGGGSGRSGSSGNPSTGKAGGAVGSLNLAGTNRSPIPVTIAGTSTQATPFGYGGGSRYTIPPNQAFAGRVAGGGTRYQVYGTS